MNLIGLIPARGGSKGIKNKNIRLLNDKPLISYTIQAAINSKLKKVFLSTDSLEIAEVAKKFGASCDYMRPGELAQDDTPMFPVIADFFKFINKQDNVDGIVLLQPTSPLRDETHINEAIDSFLKDKEATNLVSTIDVPHQYLPTSVMKEKDGYLESYLEDGLKNLLRQKKEKFIARNGPAILIISKDCILDGEIYGNKILSYPMNELDSVDIDTETDLLWADFLLRNKQK